MRTTLSEIARQTGYAKSTVSIALRNDLRLPANTRETIQDVARKLGYLADTSLAAMGARQWRDSAQHRGMSIAFLGDSKTLAPSMLAAYEQAVAAQAEALGYHFVRLDVRAYCSVATLRQGLLRRGVRGVIVPAMFDTEFYTHMNWDTFACVACGVAYWPAPLHVVNTDIFATVRVALEQTIALGHRRIGAALFMHPETAEDDSRRIGAALFQTLQERGDGVSIDVLKSRPENRDAFVQWLRRVRPEVVIGMHSRTLDWILELGYEVPAEIGVVLLSPADKLKSAHTEPNYDVVGRTAVEMLDLAIRLEESGVPAQPRTVLVQPQWDAGTTLWSREKMLARRRGRTPAAPRGAIVNR